MTPIYQEEIINAIVDKFEPELKAAANGHCMKLTGVTDDILHQLHTRFTSAVADLRCYILSRDQAQTPYVQATKLVELRNSPDEAPLLILCPATLRTAAEDSFGSATFRNLPIDDIDARINQRLDQRLRQMTPSLSVLLDFLKAEVSIERASQLLLLLDRQNMPLSEVGNQLWQVGLLPDADLYVDRNLTKARLNYNQQCTAGLCEFSRGIYDRLNALPIPENTIQPQLARFLKENSTLRSAMEIVKTVADRYPDLNFVRWQVSELNRSYTIKVTVEEIKGVQGSLIKEPDGSLVVKGVPGGTVKVKLKVTTDPKPHNVQELARFRVDLMQVTGAGEAECVYENFDRWAFTKGKQHYRMRDVAFDANTVEPGNYYLRIYALDEFNNVLNTNDDFRDRADQRRWEKAQREQAQEADRNQIKGRWTSETDNFLFIVDDEGTGPEPPPARREKVGSVLQSYFYYRLTYLYNKEQEAKLLEPETENWQWLNAADRQVKSVFQAKYKDSRFNFQVQVSSKLRQLQNVLLDNPDGLGMISLSQMPQAGLPFSAQYLTVLPSRLYDLPETRQFVEARRLFFALVKTNANGEDGIWETFDVVRHIDAAHAYVEAYNTLIQAFQQRLLLWNDLADSERDDLQAMLLAVQQLDMVHLSGRLPDAQDRYNTLLISPLHPLRIGWFVALYNLFADWETSTRADFDRQLPYWNDDLVALFFDALTPTNHPLLIGDENGQAFEYLGELAFGWGLFSRTTSQQAQGAISSINRSLIQYLQQLFDIEEQTGWIENDVDETIVFRHIHNYLSLHPYTEQITINLFNAGEGQVFRDVLLRLQSMPDFGATRYEIRLFVSERSFVTDGEAINRLINPASTLTGAADAFSQPGRNRLFPKLRFSLNRVSDFIDNPALFDCHVSFLINPFPLRPKIQVPDDQTPSFFLDGLITQPAVLFENDSASGTAVWTRYMSPVQVGVVSAVSRLVSEAFAGLSLLTSASLAGRPTHALPATELVVGSLETMLLDKIHSYSDWVVTFDRHLGPELFDLPVQEGEEPFLLDYVPGENLLGLNTFLTSKPGAELQSLMAPVVQQIVGSVSPQSVHTMQVLDDLRTLSGSLVMQLSRQPHRTKVLEYTGLALAKRLLERKGLLEHQFIIPLDLHRGLVKAESDADSESRADLLLVSVDAERRVLHLQVVEVKMRTGDLRTSDRYALYETVDDQLTNTVNRIQARFGDVDELYDQRFDQAIRAKELSDLLLFYAGRAERYGLLTPVEAQPIRSMLGALNQPCAMAFTKRGIVFDTGSTDDIVKETVGDVIFYRVGSQGLSQLLDNSVDLRTQRPGSAWSQFTQDFTTRPSQPAANAVPKRSREELRDNLRARAEALLEQQRLALASSNLPFLTIEPASTLIPDEAQPSAQQSTVQPLAFDTFIGDLEPSNQYGILGKTPHGQVVALDLSGTHTISLFGVQGAGKSYSIGSIVEMVLTPAANINVLPNPLAGVIFHYSQDQNYKPEFTSMAQANDVPREVDKLWVDYEAHPQGIEEIILLVPKAKLEERQADYPHLRVEPLAFSSAELQIQDWRFLMGAVGNQSLYIKHLNSIMKTLRNQLTLEGLKQGIQNSALLSAQQRELALSRLSLADEYIDDSVRLGSLIQPGRLLLVDLRDEFLDQDDALGLFVIMLNIFANVTAEATRRFNKFIVFDEAHKYMSNGDLTDNIVETIRLMRHKGVSVLIASQDPPSLPNAIIELSSVVLVHRFNSPQWLKHIQRSITQFDKLTPTDLSHLGPGEAYLWATKATKKQITQQPTKIITRPRFTKHGGGTRKADE